MAVKALMGLSSRSDLVTQHEPEEEKIDRQTDTHTWGGNKESGQLRKGHQQGFFLWSVGKRAGWWPWRCPIPSFPLSFPWSPGDWGCIFKPREGGWWNPVPFLCFSLLSRCLVPSPPQLSDSAKASTVLARHFSSPSPHS